MTTLLDVGAKVGDIVEFIFEDKSSYIFCVKEVRSANHADGNEYDTYTMIMLENRSISNDDIDLKPGFELYFGSMFSVSTINIL